MPGFIDALVGAQLSGGGIGSGQAKAVPVGRTSATKAPLLAGGGSKSGKGIALVFGEFASTHARWCVVLIPGCADVASATQGHVGLRAFRLTPDFIEAYRSGRFDTARSAFFVPPRSRGLA